MNVQIELWHLISLMLTVLGGYWTLAKIVAGQAQKHLDARFTAQDTMRQANHQQLATRLDCIEAANREEAGQWSRMERELLTLKAELPLQYVRREDYIRGQSVIEAKLDALGSKLEAAHLRALNGGRTHATD